MPNSTLEMRRDQMFPVLEPNEVERLRRFGTVVAYAEGDSLFRAGEIGLGMFIILKGNVAVSRKDALGHAQLIVEEGTGAFLAELNQLSGRPALVDAHAKSVVEALVVPAERLRALLIAEAELGEQIMRALILRRVGLIEEGAGPIIVGRAAQAGVLRIQGFLCRHRPPPRAGASSSHAVFSAPQRPAVSPSRSRYRRSGARTDRAFSRHRGGA